MICASGAGRSMTTECTTVPACRCLARRRSAVLDPPAAGLIPTRSAQQLLRGHRPAAERVTGGCHGRAVRPPVLATQRSATTRSADVPCLERPPWRIGVGVGSAAPKRAAVARSACQRRAISGIIPTATIPLTFSGCLTPRRVSGESRLATRSGAWNLPAHQAGACRAAQLTPEALAGRGARHGRFGAHTASPACGTEGTVIRVRGLSVGLSGGIRLDLGRPPASLRRCFRVDEDHCTHELEIAEIHRGLRHCSGCRRRHRPGARRRCQSERR